MSSHRANTSSDNDQRKSRAVRLGALLLAVVGVTAAATSAGFSNDAWFTANASSATVSLEGRLAGDTSYQTADDGTTSITIPAETFDNMLPGQTRTVELDLRNASSVPVTVAEKAVASGDLVDEESGTQISVTGFATALEADGDTTTATLTVTAGQWDDSLQDQKAAANTITVTFIGTPATK